MGRIQTKVREE